MESEDSELRLCVAEAVSVLASCYQPAADGVKAALVPLLTACARSGEPRCRLTALDWFQRLFPFADLTARSVCVTLSADDRSDVRAAAAKGLAVRSFVAAPHSRERSGEGEDVTVPHADLYPPLPAAAAFFSAPAAVGSLLPPSWAALLRFLSACLAATASVNPTSLTPDALHQCRVVAERALAVPSSEAHAADAHKVRCVWVAARWLCDALLVCASAGSRFAAS